ncbi:alpha/beta hydrolase, partial [bacterium]|nr:alpha/beta hydrolase [bacterium]
MKIAGLTVLACLLALAGCMEMDGFLANEKAVDAYMLPGNTIPDSLIESVTCESNGNTLYGFWVASKGGRPGITILYCHGNKHHIDEYWDRVLFLHELGVNLFIFDYEGFGRSEGTFSEEAMLADAGAALDYVLARPEVEADSLGLYGYSLGNVASIYLAAEVVDPLFLVAEAPFASAAALTQGALNLALPSGWLTHGTFDNAERVRRIQTPFLLFHGSDDDFVRFRDNGKVVFQNAPEPKSLRLVSGAGHNNIPQTLGLETYRALLADWIHVSVAYRNTS